MVKIKFMDRGHNHGECQLEIPKERKKSMTAGELAFLVAKLEQIGRHGILYVNGVPVSSNAIVDTWDDLWINYGNRMDGISGYRRDSCGPFSTEQVEEMMKHLKVAESVEVLSVMPKKTPAPRRPMTEKMRHLEEENRALKQKIYCLEKEGKRLEKENEQLKQEVGQKTRQQETKVEVDDQKIDASRLSQRSLDLAEQSLEKAEQKVHIYQHALLKSQDALQKAQQSALYLWNRLCSPEEKLDQLEEAVDKWKQDEDDWTKKAIKLWYRTKARQMEEELKIIQKLALMMAEETVSKATSDV